MAAARARQQQASSPTASTASASTGARHWHAPLLTSQRLKETSAELNPISGAPTYDPPMRIKSMDSRDVPMPIMSGSRWRHNYGGPKRSQPPPPPKPWPKIPGALRYPAPIPYMKPIFRKQFKDTPANSEQ